MTHTIPVPSFDLVIFGGTGDLARRKLLPALFHRYRDGQMQPGSRIVGASREAHDRDTYRNWVRTALASDAGSDAEVLERFLASVEFVSVDLAGERGWSTLGGLLTARPDNVPVYYLAVAPHLFGTACRQLGEHGLNGPRSRVVIEKPIGHDLASAREINATLAGHFSESQTFRIDHYLGKETVQNLLVLRFANSIFEPVWNNQYVDHVQVTAAEKVGVGKRAGTFYDAAGAMRDMIQSHLLQVLSLVAMEAPSRFHPDAIRGEKIKIVNAMRDISEANAHDYCVLGRYGPSGNEQDEDGGKGYADLEGVNAAGRTETYGALKVCFDNWRWNGVPFYVRSGKKMAKKLTEIVVQFKKPPVDFFTGYAVLDHQVREANRIIINIAPDDGVSLRFDAKVPGPKLMIGSVKMDLDYTKAFNTETIEAYGPLMLDAMRGDQTLYKHKEEVEGGWRVCEPAIKSPEVRKRIETYGAGSWGPSASDAMLARDGRRWHNPQGAEKR